MSVIQIELDEFLPWFQGKLDEKHGPMLQPLKSLFLSFICLSNQLIHIYIDLRERVVPKTSNNSIGKTICDNSIYILKAMTSNFPICLDLSYCQRFGKDFQEKLNMLLWYYHSLNHLEDMSSVKFKYEKDKIVEGIRKLYSLAAGIKEQVKELGSPLKNISDYKKLFITKIASIKSKIEEYQQSTVFFEEFEKASAEVGIEIGRKIKKLSQEDTAKETFMSTYFKLMNRCLSTQVQLESLLQLPMRVCNELKTKKKLSNSFNTEPNWQILSKYMNMIVKPHFVTKHIKKIKLEEFMNFIRLVLANQKDVLSSHQSSVEPEKMESRIRELIEYTLEDMRELEKIDKYSITVAIGSYRDEILPQNVKNFVEMISDYQSWMYKYYKLHDQIKTLQKIVQTSVAKETLQWVELVVLNV